jgi:chaperone LolA
MRYFFVIISFLLSPLVHADALADLKSFIQQSRSISADFTQSVVDQNGKKIQPSSGSMLIQRPGKFHWRYVKPYPSEIIGDGKKVWIYDPELKQVTIKTMTEAIDSSPAALLAGNNDFEKNYTVTNIANKPGWLNAFPKAKDSTFQRVQIALQNKMITTMVLVDQFGQTTTVNFSNIKLNPAISTNEFTFTPPKGVDVISD